MELNIKLNKDLKNALIGMWAGARTVNLHYKDMTEQERQKLDDTMKEVFDILDSNKVSFKAQNAIMWHGINNIDCNFTDTLRALKIELI